MIDLSPLDASTEQLIFLGIFTFALGIFAGMVGVALGAVRLPVMLTLRFNPAVAAGTNLGVTILGGAAASWPHWREGRVVGRVVLVIGLPAIVGSLIGGSYTDDARAWMLLTLIASLLLISSVITFCQWWQARRARRAERGLSEDQNASTLDSPRGVKLQARSQIQDGGIGW
jgi:uncharacterized membrane protein YfcA